MYDADDPGAVLNEFLVSLFVPGIVLFVLLWGAFRLRFDGALRSYGFAPIVPAGGAGAIAAGHSRFLLLVLLTTVLLPYVGAYRRFLRTRLRERGLV